MKHVFFSLAALMLASVFALPAHAETSVGVVNIGKIMTESAAAKSMREQAQSKQKAFQADLDSKEKALVKEDQEIAKQRPNLEKAAYEAKAKEFHARAAAAQREIQNKKLQIDKGIAAAIKQIQTNVMTITQEVAREKKLNLIVSSDQALYADSTLDVTADVLARLNKKLPSVSLKF